MSVVNKKFILEKPNFFNSYNDEDYVFRKEMEAFVDSQSEMKREAEEYIFENIPNAHDMECVNVETNTNVDIVYHYFIFNKKEKIIARAKLSVYSNNNDEMVYDVEYVNFETKGE